MSDCRQSHVDMFMDYVESLGGEGGIDPQVVFELASLVDWAEKRIRELEAKLLEAEARLKEEP